MKKITMLTVGEVSRRSGVAASTLHFYEAEGLLTSERSPGNQRRYRRDVLRRIAFIRVAQAVGKSLIEIAEALSDLPQQRTPTEADWSRLSLHRRTSLDKRIADLQSLRDQLDECIGCGCLSLRACGLYNPDDTLGQRGSGPQRLGATSRN